jgi:hypothetical protein
MYKVVCYYRDNRRKRTVETGLTLEQAQAICNDPETSSTTATSAAARRRTKRNGAWFYGYTAEKR